MSLKYLMFLIKYHAENYNCFSTGALDLWITAALTVSLMSLKIKRQLNHDTPVWQKIELNSGSEERLLKYQTKIEIKEAVPMTETCRRVLLIGRCVDPLYETKGL